MAAATLDVLTQGRFRLGLGVSGPQVSEGWYGVPFAKPLARTREYVEIVRQTIRRDGPVEHDGQQFQLPLGGGLGKSLKLLIRPHSESVPIYLGSIGPKATELVGEIADGWLPFMWDPRNPDVMLNNLRAGADRAGRSIDAIDISPTVPVALHEDASVARDQVRPLITFYLGSMGHSTKNFYVETAERYGHGDSARAVQERALAGDARGAAAACSDELIDACCIACRPRDLDAALARYEAAGTDTLLCFPFGDRKGVTNALTRSLAA
jgi:F420-dependent oxidoreductase-like protein